MIVPQAILSGKWDAPQTRSFLEKRREISPSQGFLTSLGLSINERGGLKDREVRLGIGKDPMSDLQLDGRLLVMGNTTLRVHLGIPDPSLPAPTTRFSVGVPQS